MINVIKNNELVKENSLLFVKWRIILYEKYNCKKKQIKNQIEKYWKFSGKIDPISLKNNASIGIESE